MADYFVELLEPVGGLLTADTTAYTADATWPTADVVSLPGAAETLDAAVGANVLFADVAEAAFAADELDAEVISAEIPVEGAGGPPPRLRPAPVVGYGYGVLPELDGEAHGLVVIASESVGELARLVGEATGTAGVAGRSAGQIVVHATAIGRRGLVGAADGALKGLAASGSAATGAHGTGLGTIMKPKAAAAGQHDDDEAAVMAFLLAA